MCTQNLELLRKLNPNTPIHGLYGGAGGVEALPPDFRERFDSLFALPFEDPQYNWQHGDICIRWWFKEVGHSFDFSHLAVVEWDLVYLKPLDEIFHAFTEEANYVALSGNYQKMYDEGWGWIQGRFAGAIEALLVDIGKERSIDIKTLSFGIFGGCVLCRKYLEELSCRILRSLSNDEVRLSLYSALFDVPLIDNGFLSDKRNQMNAENIEYGEKELIETLERGGNTIHPIRVVIPDLLKTVACCDAV
ncbi:MAG: hypothetical protein AB7S81_07620 [Bdellovibrionales bacterium]